MDAADTAVDPVKFMRLLADDIRWEIVSSLARSDHRVQEIASQLGKPTNLVSYHLAKLRGARLVRERRSDADSRDVYYSLDLDRLRDLYAKAGEELHPGLTTQEVRRLEGSGATQPSPPRVLFLCTENSARSQMAEGILRHFSRGEVAVMSAGSRPTHLHQLAVRSLAEYGIDISHHYPKSLDGFCGERFDYVVTVCDRIKEVCPTFPGDPERIHWSVSDPAAVEGDEERRYLAFKVAAKELMTMIRYLLIMIVRKQLDTA